MNLILQKIIKTVAGRWILGGTVALILGTAAIKWHNFKGDLVLEGQQVCVQEINKETVEQLQTALAAEKSARAILTANLTAAAAANQQARDRRRDLESKVMYLERAMESQSRTDNVYKEWSDASLPAGVAERLRDAQAGDNSGPVRDNQG